MTIAFIVHLNVPDITSSDLSSLSDEVHDALEHSGLDVDSVAPWQRPTLTMGTTLPPQGVGLGQPPPVPPNPFG